MSVSLATATRIRKIGWRMALLSLALLVLALTVFLAFGPSRGQPAFETWRSTGSTLSICLFGGMIVGLILWGFGAILSNAYRVASERETSSPTPSPSRSQNRIELWVAIGVSMLLGGMSGYGIFGTVLYALILIPVALLIGGAVRSKRSTLPDEAHDLANGRTSEPNTCPKCGANIV